MSSIEQPGGSSSGQTSGATATPATPATTGSVGGASAPPAPTPLSGAQLLLGTLALSLALL